MTENMKTMELVNCTPHAVNICDAEGNCKLTIAASGIIPRCRQSEQVVDTIVIDGVECQVTRQQFGEVENLPEPQDGVRYIVSRMVLDACAERNDLMVPGPTVRTPDGKIVGCLSLSVR